MLITISTYTESVPVTTAVSDLPQPNEDDEINESSGFAQLLAGLLQNTEKIQTDIPSVELTEPDINFNAIPADELIDGQEKLNLFEDSEQILKPAENEISDNEIPEEHYSSLAIVENLLNSVKTDVIDAEHFQHEDTDIEAVNDLRAAKWMAENSLENDFSETDFTAISASSAENAGELAEAERQRMSLFMEKTAKDHIPSKKENIETLASIKTSDSLKKPESENRSRLDEMRSRSRRDRVALEVRDLRTETETNAAKTQRSFSVVEAAARRTSGETPVREITLELRLPDHNGSAVQGQTIWETRSGNNGSVSTALENMLARELHQNFNGDIVRHASMALRDGGEGTIKLTLKPESLGNVKIHLEMTENKITGQIVVESKEALNAFRKEIASLEQAFRDSGFTNADLNLSLTSEGQNNQGWEQDASSFTPQMAASRYDDTSIFGDDHNTLLADVLIGHKQSSINMLA